LEVRDQLIRLLGERANLHRSSDESLLRCIYAAFPDRA
jgi:hypothetical protein